ncbi:MAG TPA: excinuclease ABC subunit UvrB, partial [Elusimicrobiales bacterium]|nr:excinuclease ABC subunit UvrB [Elusimicrobiales bacterium]
MFKVISDFKPSGDQPSAIVKLTQNIKKNVLNQILLGVTGSGKTFTIAKVIEKLNMPAIIMSPNKVLAAQLYGEFKSFLPKNAVEYFISYYDYYQPEAYIPQTDTYIEKDASINEQIDKLRLKATTSLLRRKDVVVVASVSCIYNIGSPESFANLHLPLEKGTEISRTEITKKLVSIQYERNEVNFGKSNFRMRANKIDILPPYQDYAIRVEISPLNVITSLQEFNPLTGEVVSNLDRVAIYPSKHFVSTETDIERAIENIEAELTETLKKLKAENKLLEYQRLQQRTKYDVEMIRKIGYCSGIENYSRHLSGRKAGQRPKCLLDYFISQFGSDGFLMFIDESHVSVPQIRGMYEGDRSRKQTLIDFGFRMPSALDNRPLKFSEFEKLMPCTTFLSATPGVYEIKKSDKKSVVEQIIRPTGLVDPPVSIHPTKNQIKHLIGKIKEKSKKGERCLVLSLTKKTAEDLASYFQTQKIKSQYLHSDIDTLQRIEILNNLKKGKIDVLVGINLLREGLDLPQVSLVAILEADNEGFLRSETTLVQISGRAARNVNGEVILYADKVTRSMKNALAEMSRRRKKQIAYNKKHKITPKSIEKAEHKLEEFEKTAKKQGVGLLSELSKKSIRAHNLPSIIAQVERQMKTAAESLDFELAAELRNYLLELQQMSLKNKSKK